MSSDHSGDEGFSGLLGEGRLPKHHLRFDALGAIDEATAAFGLARATATTPEVTAVILEVQRDLYRIMSEVAATRENAARFRTIDDSRIRWLEGQIDSLRSLIRVPSEFILPGDTLAGAALDMARTAVRRAERRVTEIVHSGESDNGELIRYLNRLSTLCFILELFELQIGGKTNPTSARGDTGS